MNFMDGFRCPELVHAALQFASGEGTPVLKDASPPILVESFEHAFLLGSSRVQAFATPYHPSF